MAVVINTNVASLGAQRTLARTTNALQRNIEKLSSGQRINRAADDAAGMGISENLKAQVRSLSQAERNANDGISMIQVAEAAMNEQAGVLTRLRELAVQSSNGVLTGTERAFIDAESDALVAEVDRISSVTEFNGIAMIANGTSSVNMHVGLNATGNDQIAVAFSATDAATLGTGGGGNAGEDGDDREQRDATHDREQDELAVLHEDTPRLADERERVSDVGEQLSDPYLDASVAVGATNVRDTGSVYRVAAGLGSL